MSKLKIYACSGIGDISPDNRVASSLENSGWERNEKLRQYLGTSKDGGCAEYFLYTFIPEEDLAQYSAIIYRKRRQQIKTYEYVRELFVGHGYGTEEEMVEIIRSGIENTFGTSVESVLNEIRAGKRDTIGDPTIIAAIISAVVTVVLAVISGVISYCQSVKVAKYTAPTFEELEDSAPAPTDFTKNTKRKGLILATLAGFGLIIAGTLKKNKK